MPGAQADHSHEFDVAAGGGEIRLQVDLHAAAEGKERIVEDVSKAGDEGGCGRIRRGDNPMQGKRFEPRMAQQVPERMQRGAEQAGTAQKGQGRGLFSSFS